ncbi:MAG: hypothetical protein U1F76_02885 [Candidatus Competibacteraceae bacterium]
MNGSTANPVTFTAPSGLTTPVPLSFQVTATDQVGSVTATASTQEPLKTQQEPWLLTLIWLLRERGRYALHASAVAWAERGLLIAGDSGSGKSTTALSLIHHGWDYLADDVVILEPGEPPRLHALARGFAFHPTLAARFPRLTGEAVADKRCTAIETLFPDRQIAACRVAALLFPRVVDAAVSRLEPLSSVEALSALLPASGGILAGAARRDSRKGT